MDTRYVSFVTDNRGLTYELSADVIGSLLMLRLQHKGNQVGEARCVRDGHSLLLGDLVIDNLGEGEPSFSVRRFLTVRPQTYRGRGLGGILLRSLITIAERLEIRQIHGSITQSDLDSFPCLLDWYKRYGFRVEPPTDEEVNEAVARIFLELKPSEGA